MAKRIVALLLLVLGFGIWGFSLFNNYHSPLTIDKIHGALGQSDYTIFYKNKAKLDFEITRPDKNDTSILLCIPAAFTSLDKYDVDGLYACNGTVGNRNRINHTLGGGIKIINGECTIFETHNGKLLTDSLINSIANAKGSFFQQICMIDSGKVAHFKPNEMTWRRGIAVFKDGKTAIIESNSPVELATFANDAAAFGVTYLIYTDMGAWDEGWYRNPTNGELVVLGYSKSQTGKQSNWVVFKR
jgi:hypothetical protein